jgi:uncharacterized small protein (DUF1192 family)
MTDSKFSSTNQPEARSRTVLTREQRIAQLEARLAREKNELRKKDDGQKYVIGGMVIASARLHDGIRKWLIEHIEKDVTRKADVKRVAELLTELKNLQAQATEKKPLAAAAAGQD